MAKNAAFGVNCSRQGWRTFDTNLLPPMAGNQEGAGNRLYWLSPLGSSQRRTAYSKMELEGGDSRDAMKRPQQW